jgi:hypothetical protein
MGGERGLKRRGGLYENNGRMRGKARSTYFP